MASCNTRATGKEIFKRNEKDRLDAVRSLQQILLPTSKRNTLIELPLLIDVYSEQPINVVGDEAITITINGDADLEGNTVDNFGPYDFVPFCQAIDAPPYSLLQYNNEDAGDSFRYRLTWSFCLSLFHVMIALILPTCN
jgi:hypothetical protein